MLHTYIALTQVHCRMYAVEIGVSAACGTSGQRHKHRWLSGTSSVTPHVTLLITGPVSSAIRPSTCCGSPPTATPTTSPFTATVTLKNSCHSRHDRACQQCRQPQHPLRQAPQRKRRHKEEEAMDECGGDVVGVRQLRHAPANVELAGDAAQLQQQQQCGGSRSSRRSASAAGTYVTTLTCG